MPHVVHLFPAEKIICAKRNNPTAFQFLNLNIFSLCVLWVPVTYCISLSDHCMFRDPQPYLLHDMRFHNMYSRKYKIELTHYLLVGNDFSLRSFSFVMKSVFLRGKILRLYFLFILLMEIPRPLFFFFFFFYLFETYILTSSIYKMQ